MMRNVALLGALIVAAAAVLVYFLFSQNVVQKIDTPAENGKSVVPGTGAAPVPEEKTTGNSEIRPVITGAKLDLDTSGDSVAVRVRPTGEGRKDAKLTFLYEWMKNGKPSGDGDSVAGIRRGDKLSVKVTPFDGKLYGTPETFSTEINNTPPKIAEIKEISITEDSLTYQVRAQDADGDALVYSLADAPKGMSVDQNGIIRWTFGKEDYGKIIKAKVKVSDGHGGEAFGDINFQLGTK